MAGAAELEVVVVGCKLVAIQHDLDLAAVARRPAEQFVLASLAVLAQIRVRTIRRRHAGIVFLDPPAHFRNQRLLQTGGVAEQAFGVVVFGLEIFANIGVQNRRIAQHFLPVRILQPGIVIGHGDAMDGE